ncbi:Homeodomain-containing protein [Cynara cardunculus var. scolymus]|uniref:Homeodomain-containing protein n=1 Tax=Cynara cardunculus var. scolymus TaxID=59895 RepID=A0A118JXG4_CYNCS|nr:Homeodomain-containing protein [Cynara cardunculus var. scolymus]
MFQPSMFESHHHHHLLDQMSHKTPENSLDMLRDHDDHDSRSGTDIIEPPSGDDQDPNQRPNKKKRYHRHTQHQIQEMEAFFKDCPHPDDKQRKELGRRLSLEPLQVKFWFQNKRTQVKAQHERYDNTNLRNENDKLQAENMRYKEALANTTCPNCGGPASIGEMSFDEQQLRIENARLREEIDRLSGIAAKFVGKSSLIYPDLSPHGPSRSLDLPTNFSPQHGMVGEMFGTSDLLRSMAGPTEAEKPIIIELANQWSNVFCAIVSRATTLEVLSTGVAGNYNGALQVVRESIIQNLLELYVKTRNVFVSTLISNHYMTAEYQVPSPLVPTRENYFVRYCKQHADGTWVVVDVSLDSLRSSSISRCRRRPSGCLIQELPNGYSKVLVNSGLAFGAKRWVATLDRQCERLASAMASNIPAGDVGGKSISTSSLISNPEGRKSMLKLAERMVLGFCTGVGASTAHTWTTLSGSGADDVRVMTRKTTDDAGRPAGIVLCAATSFWLPVPPKQVFNFLRDENSRIEWDILSNCGLVQKIVHIANGRDPGNYVSLLRINVNPMTFNLCTSQSANSSQSHMLILQESSCDSTGAYVIYAPVDIASMNVALSGADPDCFALLPSGFAILPDGPGQYEGGDLDVGTGGSLLTIAFQILVDSVPTSKLSLGSVATVNTLIKCTAERIKAAAASHNL